MLCTSKKRAKREKAIQWYPIWVIFKFKGKLEKRDAIKKFPKNWGVKAFCPPPRIVILEARETKG